MSIPALTKRLIVAVQYLSKKDQTFIGTALEMAITAHKGQTRLNSEHFVTHPLHVALILSKWHADAESIIAGLLHDTLEDTNLTKKEIENTFGSTVALLVEGVTKFTQTDFIEESHDTKIETLRKLLSVMRKDIRVFIIKLADRIHNVQTIYELPPERRSKFAKETMDIYYKLCAQLGLNDARRELGNICFPILHPAETLELEKIQAEKMQQAKKVLNLFKKDIETHDKKHCIETIELKPLSLPTFTKLQHGFAAKQPYLFIVIAKNRDSCYEALKMFHTLYRPISNRFRDYIAVPTDNAYQSIRTAVIGPKGNILPIHIRTKEMNTLEKEGVLQKLYRDDQDIPGFSWLDHTEEIDKSTKQNSEAFWEGLQSDIFEKTISVSVNGKDSTMPVGSTALDVIYSEYGIGAAKCSQCICNGRSVPLSHILAEEDVLSVQFKKKDTVNDQWLGYVSTAYARSMIAKSLKKRSKHQKILRGKRLLQKEFDRFTMGPIGELSSLEKMNIAQQFDREQFEEVITMIGEGVIRPRDIVFALKPEQNNIFVRTILGKNRDYPFHITITGAEDTNGSVLPQLLALTNTHDATIAHTSVERKNSKDSFCLTLKGTCENRLQFADLMAAIERQEYVSDVQTKMPLYQKIFVGLSIFSAFFVPIVEYIALPAYLESNFLPDTIHQILPLIPVVSINYIILRIMQHYIVVLRKENWFLTFGFMLNIFGIVLMTWRYFSFVNSINIIPILLLFAISMMIVASQLVQTIFAVEPLIRTKKISEEAWKKIKKQKITGYGFRLLAVCIWGLTPVLVRYSSLQQVSPLLRVHVWALIASIGGFIGILIFNTCKKKAVIHIPLTLKINKMFIIIVVANMSYVYLLHKSLLYTTAVHVNLIMSYAPIFTLLAGFMIWRKNISYFQTSKSMQQMLAIFGLSALGGVTLLYANIHNSPSHLVGDLYAFLMVVADTIFIMTCIHYFKYSKQKGVTATLTFQHLLWISIVTFVLLCIHNIFSTTDIWYTSLSLYQWIHIVILSFSSSLAYLLTFEAFKKIDGILAFLLFNLTPVIALAPEYLFFQFQINTPFIIGGIIILSSSILAEVVNSKCQRKGL